MQNIASRRIILCPINDEDIPILHTFRNRENFISFCTHRNKNISLEEFRKELQDDFSRDRHFQCLIVRKRDNASIGTIFSYSYNPQDKYAFVTTFIDDNFRRAGYGAEAIVLFSYFLFSQFALYKIYIDVYEYNSASLSAIIGSGIFQKEGIFKKQKLVDKKRFDVIRFALYRRSIKKLSDFLEKLGK
ncbi:MAG: GNAT family N-acetyltransferase [Patescibacteria group bacterium]|nr:GNAT family N-acetyltransferase [Patescibacteria group bacterium]